MLLSQSILFEAKKLHFVSTNIFCGKKYRFGFNKIMHVARGPPLATTDTYLTQEVFSIKLKKFNRYFPFLSA